MRNASKISRPRAGFTLVEILIAVAVLSLALLAIGMISTTGMGVFKTTALNTGLDSDALRAVDRISSELARADSNSLVPPTPNDGTSELLFQEVVGVEDGEPTWGLVQEVLFEYEAGELDDGVDNNHNGLVDEGVVVLRRDVGGPDERRVVLCQGVRELFEGEQSNGLDDNGNGLVDEQGFCLQWVDGVLRVQISVEEAGSGGEHVVRSLQTSVRTRNGS
jgi:prepilin-type N-terminal cleavage/methylation domain-containing protein